MHNRSIKCMQFEFKAIKVIGKSFKNKRDEEESSLDADLFSSNRILEDESKFSLEALLQVKIKAIKPASSKY